MSDIGTAVSPDIQSADAPPTTSLAGQPLVQVLLLVNPLGRIVKVETTEPLASGQQCNIVRTLNDSAVDVSPRQPSDEAFFSAPDASPPWHGDVTELLEERYQRLFDGLSAIKGLETLLCRTALQGEIEVGSSAFLVGALADELLVKVHAVLRTAYSGYDLRVVIRVFEGEYTAWHNSETRQADM